MVAIKEGQVIEQRSIEDLTEDDPTLAAEIQEDQAKVDKAEEEVDPVVDTDVNTGKLIVAEEVEIGHVSWSSSEFLLGSVYMKTEMLTNRCSKNFPQGTWRHTSHYILRCISCLPRFQRVFRCSAALVSRVVSVVDSYCGLGTEIRVKDGLQNIRTEIPKTFPFSCTFSRLTFLHSLIGGTLDIWADTQRCYSLSYSGLEWDTLCIFMDHFVHLKSCTIDSWNQFWEPLCGIETVFTVSLNRASRS